MKKNLGSSKISSEQLLSVINLSVINKIIKDDTTIITDEFRVYNLISKSTNHKHLRVNHSKSYVGDNGEHVNDIESFFNTLKRCIVGIYHHVSSKYIQSYVDEFCFRYNNKSNSGVFNLVLRQSIIS